MKKNTIRAFTLVEMLIVIVIIGILIAALMPRMSAAQGRARDVARKTDLSQMQTALISYYGDHAKFPQASQTWEEIKAGSNTEKALKEMGMTSVPKDPQQGARITALSSSSEAGYYLVKVMDRNNVKDAGLVLVAHVEVLGSANAVSCEGDSHTLRTYTDSKDIKPCSQILKDTHCGYQPGGVCTYKDDTDLVYVVAY